MAKQKIKDRRKGDFINGVRWSLQAKNSKCNPNTENGHYL